jgi:uncharacterized protein YcfL
MKKYTLLLVILVLLASCGTETSVVSNEEINEVAQRKTLNVVEQIETEIDNLEI